MQDIVIPYVQGLGESIKNVCVKYGIQAHFKSNKTLRQVLVNPKDPDPQEKKNGVIYSYQCGSHWLWRGIYRGNLQDPGECYREHLKEPCPIHAHSLHTGHQLSQDQFNITGKEDQDLYRLIKESIYIRVNSATLKRNIGKFNLSNMV